MLTTTAMTLCESPDASLDILTQTPPLRRHKSRFTACRWHLLVPPCALCYSLVPHVDSMQRQPTLPYLRGAIHNAAHALCFIVRHEAPGYDSNIRNGMEVPLDSCGACFLHHDALTCSLLTFYSRIPFFFFFFFFSVYFFDSLFSHRRVGCLSFSFSSVVGRHNPIDWTHTSQCVKFIGFFFYLVFGTASRCRYTTIEFGLLDFLNNRIPM
jgi:hypothetical protein